MYVWLSSIASGDSRQNTSNDNVNPTVNDIDPVISVYICVKASGDSRRNTTNVNGG